MHGIASDTGAVVLSEYDDTAGGFYIDDIIGSPLPDALARLRDAANLAEDLVDCGGNNAPLTWLGELPACGVCDGCTNKCVRCSECHWGCAVREDIVLKTPIFFYPKCKQCKLPDAPDCGKFACSVGRVLCRMNSNTYAIGEIGRPGGAFCGIVQGCEEGQFRQVVMCVAVHGRCSVSFGGEAGFVRASYDNADVTVRGFDSEGSLDIKSACVSVFRGK